MPRIRTEPKKEGPDEGPWVHMGSGRYRSSSTGRLKYDPALDPEWQAAIRRIAA